MSIHAGSLDSPRLHSALTLLRLRGTSGATTAELHSSCDDMAAGTTISELRSHGFIINCKYTGQENGRKRYRYTLLAEPSATGQMVMA